MRAILPGASLVLILACTRRTPEPIGTAEAHTEGPCLRRLSEKPPPEAKPVPPDQCPKDPEFPAPLRTAEMWLPVVERVTPAPLASGTGVLTSATPEGPATADAGKPPVKLVVELALNENEHAKGLMYRTSLAEDRGMLFVMERKVQHFWMKNTCLPLDMLFIDADGTISGILENVPTLNEDERTIGCPTTYVLEVNAGWTRRHGVRPGSQVTLPKR